MTINKIGKTKVRFALLIVAGIFCIHTITDYLLSAEGKTNQNVSVLTGNVSQKEAMNGILDSLLFIKDGKVLKGERYIIHYRLGSDAVTIKMNVELLGINGSLLDFKAEPGDSVVLYRGSRDSIFVIKKVDYTYDGGRSCTMVGFKAQNNRIELLQETIKK